ncbi:MAG TPA: fumarylacetoacetate hydrolase family protein [Syntrophorhabdales bacterium]|nr:fumarylacetoacetate hydrolase family protein [Syntrophorhabdales bacterium]
MKFVTFEVKTPIGPVQRIGVLKRQGIIDLHAAYASYLRDVRGIYRWQELAEAIVPPDMLKFIEGGAMSMEAALQALDHDERSGDRANDSSGARTFYELNEVRLLAPVPRPLSIRDCSAFLQHVKNARARAGLPAELPQVNYEIPAHYRTSTTDVSGPDEPVFWPGYTEKLDYELEIALCIGKQGVNIRPDAVNQYIFGYTIFNDISARDIQRKEMELKLGPAKAKTFQSSNIMGPCLVTPDEIDAGNLRMTARINGEIWSDGNTGDMQFTFAQLVSYISKDDPLYPGEFIASGTVGFGCGLELDRWIKPGDILELEVEGIGVLRNKVSPKA